MRQLKREPGKGLFGGRRESAGQCLGRSKSDASQRTPGIIKAIGLVEVLGGVGMVLPALLDIAPILVPIAASGMALYMSGAVTTRLRRCEYAAVVG